ncbi:hypothetical protein [Cycloclasticus pugetii]|uniref:hypothetical protein n=1 Tax=Cycloclasticus pugetii TaxID=34068 RepID=UPI003A8EDAA7
MPLTETFQRRTTSKKTPNQTPKAEDTLLEQLADARREIKEKDATIEKLLTQLQKKSPIPACTPAPNSSTAEILEERYRHTRSN